MNAPLLTTTRRCLLALIMTTCAFAPNARADVFSPLRGARSFAMGGAHRGLGSSNEALWLNPGGLSLLRRYSIDVQYDYAGSDSLQRINGSVVDSKSGPVAGGASYTRDWGNPSGVDPAINRSVAGTSVGLGEVLGVGVGVNNVTGAYTAAGQRQKISEWSGTLGLAANIGQVLGLGAVYHNLVHPSASRLLSPSLGFGIGGRASMLSVAGDLEVDLRDAGKSRLSYHAGAEAFLMEIIAVRAGYRFGRDSGDPAPKRHYLSGGIGIINQSFGLNFAMERSLERGGRWDILGSLQTFL